MAEFEFQAATPAGEIVRGTLQAADEAAAKRELQSRGWNVVDLLWAPAVDESGTLTDAQLTMLVNSMGAAATNHVPLEFALSMLADEKEDPRLADVARRLADRLDQGMPVADALAGLEHELPAELRCLLLAGLETGKMDELFDCFTRERLTSQRIARHIRAAIAYPLFVLALTVPVLLFISLYVVPMFAEMYADFELDLPQITELVLQTSEQLPGLIFGLLAVMLIIPLALRLAGGRWIYHRVRAALPILGPMWTLASQREFASLLAALLELRLPLSHAVVHTGDLMTDRNIARACRRIGERLVTGQSLGESLAHSINFDRSLVAMVAWGEHNGVLSDAMRIAAEVFDDRVEQRISLVRRILPPLALVSISTIAVFSILGLFIPLITLIEGLS